MDNKTYFVRPGSNTGNHRIFVNINHIGSSAGADFLKSVTAWKDKVIYDEAGNIYHGYETVNPGDANHIISLLKSVFGYEEISGDVRLTFIKPH